MFATGLVFGICIVFWTEIIRERKFMEICGSSKFLNNTASVKLTDGPGAMERFLYLMNRTIEKSLSEHKNDLMIEGLIHNHL